MSENSDDSLVGEVRANEENAWKCIRDREDEHKIRVRCVQGPREGDTEKISRVDFTAGLFDPEEFENA